MLLPPSLFAIEIVADGASRASMREAAGDPRIAGLTTNSTLMRKARVADYGAFMREVLAEIRDKPISFEVFAGDPSSAMFGVVGRDGGATRAAARTYVVIPTATAEGITQHLPVSHPDLKRAATTWASTR
jgi:hypothetical protein